MNSDDLLLLLEEYAKMQNLEVSDERLTDRIWGLTGLFVAVVSESVKIIELENRFREPTSSERREVKRKLEDYIAENYVAVQIKQQHTIRHT